MDKKKKRRLWIWGSVATILVLIVSFCLVYLFTYYGAKDVDKYLKSDNEVTVTEENNYIFFDNKNNASKVFVFYPGARVDEKAYAPIVHELSENGVDCFLMKMPCHMAIFNINAADEIMKNYSYGEYYIGGHSMGGAMAAKYVQDTSYIIKGLIFYAAYSAYDISSKDVAVLSLYGSNDQVIKKNKIVSGRDLVNKSLYNEYVIEGGNHGQFGSYGQQKGDGEATISKEEQWNIAKTKTLEFMNI